MKMTQAEIIEMQENIKLFADAINNAQDVQMEDPADTNFILAQTVETNE